jgi:pimeloyl-ACP methyl ester carboxylesterase
MTTLARFEINVPDDVLEELRGRLAHTRWPEALPDAGWRYGTDLGYMQELVDYWLQEFDWRKQEQLLNAFPQFTARLEDIDLHFIHAKGVGPRPIPLLLSHGWPGSIFEMHKVIGPLTNPASHGGDPADAFDVVVPSLPGYGFSGPTSAPGVDVARIAELFVRLMEILGYDRFVAQGGDWGSYITTTLGRVWHSRVAAIHLNTLPGFLVSRVATDEEKVALRERARKLWSSRRAHAGVDDGGYAEILGTRPQSLAYGLNDSPAGLAAWIIEKFFAWSDCGGNLERVFTKDELLTNIMIYWVTETSNSAARLYYETTHGDPDAFTGRVEAPTALAVFPAEGSPPRTFVERIYNVERWTEMPTGGHFAALEQPEALVEDIREFFRPYRDGLTA